MKYPIVSIREATQQGNWFVFGLGIQRMVAQQDNQRMECHDTLEQTDTLLGPVRLAAQLVNAPDFEHAFSKQIKVRSTMVKHHVTHKPNTSHQQSHNAFQICIRSATFPFRSWWNHCVRGKAREDAHPSGFIQESLHESSSWVVAPVTHGQNPCSMCSTLYQVLLRVGHERRGRTQSCCRRWSTALHGKDASSSCVIVR